MLDFPRWRVWMLNTLIIVGVAFAIPSLLPTSMRAQLAQFVPTPTINLGLDLAGGSHILLEADTSQLAEARLEALEDSVRTALRRADPQIAIADVSRSEGKLSFNVTDMSKVDAAREVILPLISNAMGARDWDLGVNNGNRIVLSQSVLGTKLHLTKQWTRPKTSLTVGLTRLVRWSRRLFVRVRTASLFRFLGWRIQKH